MEKIWFIECKVQGTWHRLPTAYSSLSYTENEIVLKSRAINRISFGIVDDSRVMSFRPYGFV